MEFQRKENGEKKGGAKAILGSRGGFSGFMAGAALFVGLCGALTLSAMSVEAWAADEGYIRGRDYVELKKPLGKQTSAKNEGVVFFRYDDEGSRLFAKEVARLSWREGPYVYWAPSMSRQKGKPDQWAILFGSMMESGGFDAKIHEGFFELAKKKKGAPPEGMEACEFVKGISGAQRSGAFCDALSGGRGQARAAFADVLAQSAGANANPLILVNGKKMSGLDRAQTPERLAQIFKGLLENDGFIGSR